jgi:hypothetical protein
VANLPAAAAAVRDLFAASGGYFEWAGPAKVVDSRDGGLPEIVLLTVDNVVNEVHRWGRPIKFVDGRRQGAITFPDRAARQYLAMKGEWRLPRLAGITTAPLLRADGSIQTVEGYDPETRLYCANVLALEVPSHPTEDQARAALQTLRAAFETFPFADSPRRRDAKLGLDLVDLAAPPGRDESAFLAGLITAVCRPSLQLAPGFMLVAAQTSGSGSGKGLLARAIGLIAYDRPLAGFTPTKDKGELRQCQRCGPGKPDPRGRDDRAAVQGANLWRAEERLARRRSVHRRHGQRVKAQPGPGAALRNVQPARCGDGKPGDA